MTLAEFEEKELEGPLNVHLCTRGLIWSPGQVLEKIVGFDTALEVLDQVFWSRFGAAATPSGAHVSAAWWPGWPSLILRPVFKLRSPPQFRLNLFLQYKRPEHLQRGQESKHWQQPYYRFLITPHQQKSLEACARALGSNGVTAYGSPVFHRRADLFHHVEQRTLVANTHFAPVLPLAPHSRYTYVSATGSGKGHSEPQELPSLNLGSGGDGPPDGHGAGDGRPPLDILREARAAARAAIDANDAIVVDRRTFDRVQGRARAAVDFLMQDQDAAGREAIENLVFTTVFADLSGVQWHVR